MLFRAGASPAHRPPGFSTDPPAGVLPAGGDRDEFTPQIGLDPTGGQRRAFLGEDCKLNLYHTGRNNVLDALFGNEM